MFKYCLLLIPALILSATSCKKKGCTESAITKQKLQGNWVHDYPVREADFTQPDQYRHIRFEGDSFFLRVTIHTDIVLPFADPCEGNDASGVYEISGGKLLLHGAYTNTDPMACNMTGVYEQAFHANFCNADLMLKEVSPKINWPNYNGPKMVKE